MTPSPRSFAFLRVSLALVSISLLSAQSRAATLQGTTEANASPAGRVGGIAVRPMDREALSTNGITLERS